MQLKSSVLLLFLLCILLYCQGQDEWEACTDVSVDLRLQHAFKKLFDRASCHDADAEVQICDYWETGYVCENKKNEVQETIRKIIGCSLSLKDEFVYDMNKEFMDVTAKIVDLLTEQKTLRETLRIAEILRKDKRMSYRLWYKAMVGVRDRYPELQKIELPEMVENMPELFVPSQVLDKIQFGGGANQKCVVVDESGGVDNGEENLLFYFREDIGVNSHHSYWHSIHGWKKADMSCLPDEKDPYREINKTSCHEDRRGELFYYMHRSLLARYATERMSHCMVPLLPYRFKVGGYIDNGYKPHMRLRPDSDQVWNDRPHNHPLPDEIMNQQTENKTGGRVCERKFYTVLDLLKNIHEVEKMIFQGYFLDKNNNEVKLTIDWVGDIVEASNKNPDQKLYGEWGVHNLGHDIIAKAINPKKINGSIGVMGDTATAMRDPIFYRWHAFIDELMDRYKRTLEPYPVSEGEMALLWGDIHIQDVKIRPFGRCGQENQLNTFWSQQKYKLFNNNDHSTCTVPPTEVCVKHLDHEDFQYEIVFENREYRSSIGTVRVFMSPRYNEDGLRLTLLEQRQFIFVLDTFNVNVQPGQNRIVRKSTDSNLTRPRQKGTGTLINKRTANVCKGQTGCGCGWPHHLLLPKGTETGMTFDLFVMITDGMKYRFDFDENSKTQSICKAAPLFCGIPGTQQKYPDIDLPMGYPFDRLPYKVPPKAPKSKLRRYVASLEEFATNITNMHISQVTIIHRNFMVEDGPWYEQPAAYQPTTSQGRNTMCKSKCASECTTYTYQQPQSNNNCCFARS